MSKAKRNATHYKRVHDDGQPENEDSSRQNTFYCAAAEDDRLGWELSAAAFDPMYTVNRRNREADSESKASFFKKLKVRLEQTDNTEPVVRREDESAAKSEKSEPLTLPHAGITKFGFGMMGGAGTNDTGKDNSAKKSRKDKKGKHRKHRSK
ncbi:hypothetical protein H4S01_005145 [Coemansia sp. RSA 2610]|nr:hypothetical protein H4S01_005145 [Coemansia sp. RSA 2610]